MKINHPLGVAMATIGKTVAGIIGVFLVGVFIISMLWGDEGAAFSLFTIGFMLLATIALIRAITSATKRFVIERAQVRNHNQPELPQCNTVTGSASNFEPPTRRG